MEHGESAADLSRIHAVITRSLRASVEHARHFAKGQGKGEAEAFVTFVETAMRIVHSHHHTEEEIVLPLVEARWADGPVPTLKDEHKEMEDAMAAIDGAVATLKRDDSPESYEALAAAMEALEALWLPHIEREEQAFTSDKLRELLSFAEEKQMAKESAAHGRKNSGPGPVALPMLLFNLDDAERKAFEGHLPWIVRKVLVPIFWKSKWRPLTPYMAFPPN